MRNRLVFLGAVAAVTFAAGGAPAQAQLHAQYYVLDAFGGVHAGGGASLIVPATPYFGFDVTADLTYVPVGTAAAVGDGLLVLDKWGGVHLGGALAADPPSGGTPYFGFDAARARFSTNVDSTAGDPQILAGFGYAADLNCVEDNLPSTHNSFQKLYPVTAGSHTAYVLYRHNAGSFTTSFDVFSPSITVTFIDQSATGASMPEMAPMPTNLGIDPLRR